MKTIVLAAIRCSLMFTAVAVLSVAYPAKANLIANPGFETGDFTGWPINFSWDVRGTNRGIPPHSGNFQAASLSVGDLAQTLATTAGQSYTINFWAATPTGGSLNVSWGDSTVFPLVFLGATGYTEFTFTVTASSASTQILFDAFTPNLLLDDISVIPGGPVPDGGTTVSLLGCALLGLVAFRRKLRC